MAHSPWMIPSQSEKTANIATKDTKKNISASQNGSKNSFAAVMAKEQSVNKTSSAKGQTRPTVAKLPNSGIPLNNTVLAGRTPSEMARLQTFNKARTDLTRTRSLDSFATPAGANASILDMARNMGTATNLRTIAASNNGAGFALSSSDFIRTRNHVSKTSRASRNTSKNTETAGIGKLSARFESGSDGIAAIGYDRNGGTSYGKYQIASRVGSMKSFISFLDSEAPDLAKRLRDAGPANTGCRTGKMPTEWKAIAKEQPERFEQLQETFIRKTHYDPALAAIGERTQLNTNSLSPAMREVIWSTAVQHGPAGAARIFAQADSMSGKSDASYERKLITNVYNIRTGQFGSSSSQVRESVRNRFNQEKQLALKMLQSPQSATLA